jgi:hypothetical protein
MTPSMGMAAPKGTAAPQAGLAAIAQPAQAPKGMSSGNMAQVMAMARKMSDAQLAEVLQGKSLDVPQYVAMTEAMGRKSLRTAMNGAQAMAQAQQPSVKQKLLMGDQPQMQGIQQGMPQMSQQPVMAAEGGLMYADGGSVDMNMSANAGGGIAELLAVMNDGTATVFNAPKVSHLLDDLKAKYPNDFIGIVDDMLRFLPRPAEYLFLYFFGFYGLLLVLKIDPLKAFFGALAFGFSTYMIVILGVGHNAKAHAIAYMPLVLAGIIMVFRKKYVVGGLLTMLAVALEINANHFQMTYYLLFLLLVISSFFLFNFFIVILFVVGQSFGEEIPTGGL